MSASGMMLISALKYARMGWSVFPAPPGQKKSYKSASHSEGRRWGKTLDPEEIRRDWERWPEANIGLPTGRESGFWVLEADTQEGHGVDGIANLRALEERHGELPPTRMAASPSGSVHYYFRWLEGAEVKNSSGRVAPGVDVRGEGGMVIAPPSQRRDGTYRWLNDLDPGDPPQWLLGAVAEASRRPSSSAARTSQVDLDKIQLAMRVIPNEDLGWEEWNNLAMALFAATGGGREGRRIFHAWSSKSRKYDEGRTDAKWNALKATPPTAIGVGTIYFKASEAAPGWDRISLEDFYAYMPQHDYIFVPTGEHWPAASVNALVPPQPLLDRAGQPVLDSEGRPRRIKASTWLDSRRHVEQMTWAPGQPKLIENRLVKDGGWIDRWGTASFNRYRAPNVILGSAARAGPWLDHCDKLLGEDGRRHVVSWLAHRVQRPEEKINHALVLGGAPGIGKDTLLEPVKRALGHWNFAEASPQKLLGSFNAGYLEAVILRVSEARDLGDVNRYTFYDHMKLYTAAPPDVLKVNEKFVKEYVIFNCVGIIYTTNYKQNGIFIPADDRRHYVLWSDLTAQDFDPGYWNEIWDWYNVGGDSHVAAYLSELDLTGFNAKAAPPRTEAFWAIVNAGDTQEDSELADVIDQLGNPTALTVQQIRERAGFGSEFEGWLSSHKTRRIIPHRLEKQGYVAVRNPDSQDGVWKVEGRRTPIYALGRLAPRDQIEACRACKTRIEAASSGGPRIVS